MFANLRDTYMLFCALSHLGKSGRQKLGTNLHLLFEGDSKLELLVSPLVCLCLLLKL